MEDIPEESDIQRMLEEEHNIQIGGGDADGGEEDVMRQSYDIDEFEKKMRKLKTKKIAKGIGDSDDSDDDEGGEGKRRNKQVSFQGVKAAKGPTVEEIQNRIVTQQRAKVQQSEEFQIAELLKSGNDGMKERKIKELLTRNRNLQVQYEREKAQRLKVEGQLNQMIKDNEEALAWKNVTGSDNAPKNGTQRKSTTAQAAPKDDTQSVKSEIGEEDWRKKFQEADKKIQEMRVKHQNTKNELNKALRVIAREIGENFEIDKVLMDENGWKGRAQQIEKLKAKVRDLQGKLGASMTSNTHTSGFSQMSDFPSGGGGGGLQFGATQGAQNAAERRREVEQLKEANEKYRSEIDILQSKIKAVTSRKTILENEVKDLKNDYEKNKRILMEKSENDDKFIKALKGELEKLKKQKQGEQRVIYKNQCEHDHREPEEFERENLRLRKDNQYLRDEVEQKEKMIKELIEDKIKNGSGGSGQFAQDGSSAESQALIKKLETELKLIKKEKEELLKLNISDQETKQIIKDLSMQNARLRAKLDDFKEQKK